MNQETMEKLAKYCQKFISEQQIRCSESVYQCDWVIENVYEFIEGVCEIVGYYKDEENNA